MLDSEAGIGKTTRISRYLALLLLAFFGIQWVFPASREYLALVPGRFVLMRHVVTVFINDLTHGILRAGLCLVCGT
jgi:hypothetical protein